MWYIWQEIHVNILKCPFTSFCKVDDRMRINSVDERVGTDFLIQHFLIWYQDFFVVFYKSFFALWMTGLTHYRVWQTKTIFFTVGDRLGTDSRRMTISFEIPINLWNFKIFLGLTEAFFTVWITGWGLTKEDGRQAAVLQELQLRSTRKIYKDWLMALFIPKRV